MRRIRIALAPRQKRDLIHLMRSTKDAKLRIRAHIVLLYSSGLGCCRIARQLHCAPATAVNTINRFLEAGLQGLPDRRKYNGARKVTPSFIRTVKTILAKSPRDFGWRRPTWTKELMIKVLVEKGLPEVSRKTLSSVLRSQGIKWKSARPIVNCPWPKEQREQRLQEIRDFIDSLPKNEVILYEDEVDIHLNPKIGRDWNIKGKQREILTPGKNEKRYLAGALDRKTKQLIWVMGERKNSDLFIDLLDWLLVCYPTKKRIHLIMDNYVIHFSWKTIQWLEDHGERFEFHFLPPYCPSANKIERFWVDLHGNVTRNHRCRTMAELLEEVKAWLDSDEKHARMTKKVKKRAA